MFECNTLHHTYTTYLPTLVNECNVCMWLGLFVIECNNLLFYIFFCCFDDDSNEDEVFGIL